MAHISYIVLFFALLTVSGAAAENISSGADTLAVRSERMRRAVEEHLDPAVSMTAPVRENPAIHGSAFALDLTEVSVGGGVERHDVPRRMSEGEGETYGAFNATSYRRLSAGDAVWGEAGYRRSGVQDVLWRSSADYDIVFPYITADSVGGDLKSEEYTFGGGYGRSSRSVAWGIEGGVRALHEWRTIDPRPRNIAIDLDFKAGAALRVGRYMVGAAIAAKVYKQKGNVDFYNPVGVVGEYHLSGIGAHYGRFTGVDAGSLYRGGGYNLTVTLTPATAAVGQARGLHVAVDFGRQSIEKILVAYNNLPLQRIIPRTASADVAWIGRSGGLEWGVSLHGGYSVRSGVESVVGEKISNIYAVVAHLPMYRYGEAVARAGAFVACATRRGEWSLAPWLEYRSQRERYRYPEQRREADIIAGGVDGVMVHNLRRVTLRAEAGIGGRVVPSSLLAIPVADIESALVRMVQYDFSRQSMGAAEGRVAMRVERPLKRGLGLFARGEYGLVRWGDGNISYMGTLSVGIFF